MKCPKKHVKEEFIMWWHMHFFRNAPKSKMFIFGSFSVFRIKREKWGISKKKSIEKWGISKKKHVINSIFPIWLWKQKMDRKWASSILGHFQKKMHMPSPDKFLFHMPFGAFHITPPYYLFVISQIIFFIALNSPSDT